MTNIRHHRDPALNIDCCRLMHCVFGPLPISPSSSAYAPCTHKYGRVTTHRKLTAHGQSHLRRFSTPCSSTVSDASSPGDTNFVCIAAYLLCCLLFSIKRTLLYIAPRVIGYQSGCSCGPNLRHSSISKSVLSTTAAHGFSSDFCEVTLSRSPREEDTAKCHYRSGIKPRTGSVGSLRETGDQTP